MTKRFRFCAVTHDILGDVFWEVFRRARVAYRPLSRPDEVTLYEVRLRELKQGPVRYVRRRHARD